MSSPSQAERLLNELDHRRLALLRGKSAHQDIPEEIDELLEGADTLPPSAMPPDVITMHSQILVEDEDGTNSRKLVLCYPPDSDPTAGRLSVLSPLGAALLGQRKGALVRWDAPDGTRKSLRIAAIPFQPEANGDYTR